MPDDDPTPLDYAPPDLGQPTERKQTAELFREPPALATWTVGDLLVWVISFVVLLFICLVLIGWWLSDVSGGVF